MSWHQSGGNSATLSRNQTCVKRQEMQVSCVRLTARVMEPKDRLQHITDAVDGVGYGPLSILKTRGSSR